MALLASPTLGHFCILASLWLAPVTPCLAATFYIDPSSTAGGLADGSLAHPYLSWDDVDWIEDSTYLQRRGTTCEPSRAIHPTVARVTLGAYGQGIRPKIHSLIGDRAKAIDYGAGSLTVTDLDISSSNDIVAAIMLGGPGPHLIANCVLHDCSWGIRAINVTGKITIQDAEIHQIGDDGIFTQDTGDIEVSGCYIHHVNVDLPERPEAGGDCIQISGQQGALYIHDNILDHSTFGRKFCLIIGSAYEDRDDPDDALVERNVMIGYRDATNPSTGVYLKKTINHLTFRYNLVRDAATGIFLLADTTAHNNLFIRCDQGVTLNTGIRLDLYNNTLINNVTGIRSNYGSEGSFYNNLFYRGPQTADFYQLAGNITSDYNLFSHEGDDLFQDLDTLSQWVNDRNRDHHSRVGLPQFANAATGDYHLLADSPGVNQGYTLSLITRDYDGTPVPWGPAPDIGAYEYNPAVALSLTPRLLIPMTGRNSQGEPRLFVVPMDR